MLLATNRQKATRRAAFTLLEVLVVVAILVILAGVATVATTSYLEQAKKSKAHLGAKGVAQAIESYQINSANTTNEFPNSLQDLLQPPWGGTSLLRNGQEDLRTPWNQEYIMERAQRQDGTEYILVYTTSPDGTVISQFGIGEQNARPKF